MIIDTQLQALPAKTHVQSDGSDIGGWDPAKYGYEIVPGSQSLLMWTEGSTKAGTYPAWMWYPGSPRPILAGPTSLRMSAEFMLGGDLTGLNVRETDVEVVYGGRKYNGSLQFNQSKRLFQIADDTGNWLDVGTVQPRLLTDVPYRLTVDYSFDILAHTMRVGAITQNGVLIATTFVQAAQPCTWTEGVYVQLQMGSLPSAQKWTMLTSGLQLEWDL